MQLYKFVPISPRAIVSLVTGKFWASSLDRMNDPFEDRFTDMNSKILVNNCGVLSLSSSETINGSILSEPLMWAHYASNHMGIAIGLVPSDNKSKYFKIEYLLKEDIDKKFEELIQNYKGKEGKVISPWQEIFFKYKSIFWNYENEYRQVYLAANNMYVDPFANINEVVFGFRSRPEEELAVWSALKDKVNYKKMQNKNGTLQVEEYNPPKSIETISTFIIPMDKIGESVENIETALSIKKGKFYFK